MTSYSALHGSAASARGTKKVPEAAGPAPIFMVPNVDLHNSSPAVDAPSKVCISDLLKATREVAQAQESPPPSYRGSYSARARAGVQDNKVNGALAPISGRYSAPARERNEWGCATELSPTSASRYSYSIATYHEESRQQGERATRHEINARLVASKSGKEALYFSKQARPAKYSPCTVSQYLREKPKEYIQLGALQPDLQAPDLLAKHAATKKVNEYADRVKETNRAAIEASKRLCAAPQEKKLQPSKREKAAAYAAGLRRPRPALLQKTSEQASSEAELPHLSSRRQIIKGDGCGSNTRLEELEIRHEDMRKKVQQMKEEFKRRGIVD
jgi:hypothetical protein